MLLAASSISACYRSVRSRARRVHKQTWLSDYILLIIISLTCAEFNRHLLVIPPGPYHAIMPRCCHQRMPLHFVFGKKSEKCASCLSCVWWFTLCVQYAQAIRLYFTHKVKHHTQYACIHLVLTTTHNMEKLHTIDHSLCACNTSVNHALEAEWEVQGRDICNVGADDVIACGVCSHVVFEKEKKRVYNLRVWAKQLAVVIAVCSSCSSCYSSVWVRACTANALPPCYRPTQIRPSATSVFGLKLQVYQAFSY